ncbi:restriction endonuclease [Paenibacillus sediminis]|uniref:Restriction endonuclease type IV Mrr domain-containing protein n=1 Tax=Paenibacillus sediminis TaxID=664909 RepID=A0ABS4H627_9BACL|nr:restriction endonuclease [Paenibacillus sediminis]MBP1937980.1 hypothetical protein [Paenibacillus sediminis]
MARNDLEEAFKGLNNYVNQLQEEYRIDSQYPQFQKDRKLENIKIENIYFLDDEEEGLVLADLYLYGYSFHVNTYHENGEHWKQFKNRAYDEAEIFIEITPSENYEGKFIIRYKDCVFSMELENAKIVENHAELMNKPFYEKRIMFKNEVDVLHTRLKSNVELFRIIDKFISQVSNVVFFEFIIQVGIEYKLEQISDIGKLYFSSSSILREVFANSKLGNEKEVSDYFDNDFSLLVKLIARKFEIDNREIAYYLTYSILRERVIRYFALNWKEQYGEYFNDVESSSLDELIFEYISIDSINPDIVMNASPFTYFLMYHQKFINNDNFIECIEVLSDILDKAKESKELDSFEKKLLTLNEDVSKLSIEDVDMMDGHEFERFVAKLFVRMGYSATVTKGSGDQGVDVIVEKNGRKYGIQAKCLSNAVNNKAIQEVVAGISHYRLDKAIVVTNRYFNSSATELALSNNVVLWDRDVLKEKIEAYY